MTTFSRRRFVLVSFLVVLLVATATTHRVAAAPPASAVTLDDIDVAQCRAFADDQELPAPTIEAIAAALRLTKDAAAAPSPWSTGSVASEVRHFRIVFKRPVAVGTLCSPAEAAVLNDAAPLPGNVYDETQWTRLNGGLVRPLPPQAAVRAVRLTVRVYNHAWDALRRETQFPGLWLLSGRYFDPSAYGRRVWSSTSQPNAATKKNDPYWQALCYWPAARKVSGLLLDADELQSPLVTSLDATQLSHPQTAAAADWREVPTTRSGALLAFAAPIETHAVRLLAAAPKKPLVPLNKLLPAIPLVELSADEPAPDPRTFSFTPAAPLSLQYEMPLDGFAAIRIEDESGKHVRRLIAEVERGKGAIVEPWDLRDDDGRAVPPGNYRFFGLARPPLKLTHEITVYNAGNPPWMAPVKGGGWWMADHSPPMAACAVGDVMFFSAGGAEFGVPLIATDLDGNKVWHDLHQRAERLVSDGRYAYIVSSGEVIRIDPSENFKKQSLHKFQYSDQLPGHGSGYIAADRSGAAVFGQTLAVSYSGTSPPRIRSGLNGGDIDWTKSVPRPLPKKVHETDLDPQQRILSALQLLPSSLVSKFGPAPQKGPLARTMLLALKRDVPLGGIVLPAGDVQAYALRPGATLPPEFVPPETPDGPSGVAKLPEPSLDFGGGGKSTDLLEDFKPRFDPKIWMPLKRANPDRDDVAVPETPTTTRMLAFASPSLEELDYALVLDRRYRNATSEAEPIALEGNISKHGAWEFRRFGERPISYGDPAVAGFVWPQAKQLRGFLLSKPVEWSGTAVDVWTGAEDAKIDAAAFRDDANWKQVYLHKQTRNHIKFNWHTDRVLVGDFGEVLSVRALRIRVVEPPNGAGYQARPAVSGGFHGFVSLEPYAGDPETEIDLAQRVTVLDLPAAADAKATVRTHLPVPHPSALAFDKSGNLYVACDDGICKLPLDGKSPRAVVVPRSEFGKARALAFGEEGLLYLLDGTRQRVLVFDPQTQQLVREFGKSGGAAGPYDPQELSVPTALAIDKHEKLWIVETHFQPKRISRWSKEGQVEKELFGPTHYGGGGMLDSGDRTVINHLGMKFRIDYATRTWKLEARLAMYGTWHYMPDRVAYKNKHRYLIGDRPVVTPFGDSGPMSVICEERNGKAVPLVVSGILGDWREFTNNTALQQLAAGQNPASTAFVWTDKNDDAAVQAEEVLLLRDRQVNRSPYIGDDLSLNFPGMRPGFRLRAIAGDAVVPQYDLTKLEEIDELTNQVMVTDRGETLVMQHKLLDDAGHKQWTYPDRYAGVQASYQSPWGFTGRPPGALVGSLGPVGYFEIAGERLFCVNSNNGDYYAFTHDGLLAAAIVGGPRGYGKRYFTMPDYVPGKTDLTDLRKTVEDFHGHVTRADDGRVYAIAGKNHVTLMSVDGLEGMKRFEGTATVTRDDLEKTQDWITAKSRIEKLLDPEGAKRYRVTTLPKAPTIDGETLTDWPDLEPLTIHTARNQLGDVVQLMQAKLAFDSENLYVAGYAIDRSPLQNGFEDPAVLFQYGDAFDLHLGLNPQAPAERNEAAPGDVRLLFTQQGDRPIAMFYRYVDGPGGPTPGNGAARTFTSPTGEEHVAEIRPLADVRIAFVREKEGWNLEAAIPWKSLGVAAPSKSAIWRGDLGVLESDPNGKTTIARYYWANKRQVTISDQPSEARVLPGLWGEFEFVPSDFVDSLLDK